MILGMSLELFTRVHVLISLIAIAAGMLVLLGFLTKRRFPILTAVYFITTALTDITGFMFPFKGMTPGIVIGIVSLLTLLMAAVGLYGKHLSGGWRAIYVILASLALWLNVFVLFAQLFQKVPELVNLGKPAFGLTEGLIFILFIAVTFRAVKRFHPE
jgi:hypothetical protein